MIEEITIEIYRGETVAKPVRTESDVLVWRPVTGIPQTTPLHVTAVDHGCPKGWRAALAGFRQPREINAENNPPSDRDLQRVKVVDDDTVEFNRKSASTLKPYTNGGYLVFYEPLDLSLYARAVMRLRDACGNCLTEFSTDDNTLDIDEETESVWLLLDSIASAELEFDQANFEIDLITAGGESKRICKPTSRFLVHGKPPCITP